MSSRSHVHPTEILGSPKFWGHLITWAHSSPATGHLNSQHTYQLPGTKYWWENMMTDITKFISYCSTCAQAKVSQTPPADKLMPLPTPQKPWSHRLLAIDFITDLPKSQDHTVIMVVINQFSKALRLIPFPGLLTAFKTAELIHSEK